LLDRLFALETFGIKLGLENIRRLCEALDHPERAFTSIHVAGTNGKGSVTAMVHAALDAAGIRAGRYTSPHLVHLNERFVVGDAPVEDAALVDAATVVLDCADRLQRDGILAAPPTFFEATTAMAFEIFRRAKVDVAVVEVGLGGRFDATNVLEPPVGAITSIALDHQQQLGDTLAKIAFEKAGIVKPGMTLVVGALPSEASEVIGRIANESNADLIDSTRDSRAVTTMEDGRARVAIETPSARYGPLLLALRGEHQIRNALVAVRLLEAAREHGVRVPPSAIEQGLVQVQWPARLELLTMTDGRRVLLDAAHNAEGAHALREYLARWHPDRPLLVVGVMRDKDAESIVRELLPVTSSVIVTAAMTPRAMPAKELASRVRALDASRPLLVCDDVSEAVDRALESNQMVCVAGSIFLVGAVRERFLPADARRARVGEPDILR
jgi:dihydrofolate synthase/folylpolyglutamate synthase